MNKFYVYAILDPRKPGEYIYDTVKFQFEPFYIGKGSNRRITRHLTNSEINKSTFKSNKIKKILSVGLQPVMLKIQERLTEKEALRLEMEIISTIGKTDHDGPLTNQTDGGDGISGFVHTKETKERIRSSLQGVNKGRRLSQEWKNKIRANNAKYWTGKHHTNETKHKLSIRNKGRRLPDRCHTYNAVSPNGDKFVIKTGLKYFCEEHGLSRSKMVAVATGNRTHHRGWTCTKTTP